MALYRDAASAVLRLHCLAKEINWHSSSLYPGNNTPPSPQSQPNQHQRPERNKKDYKLELIENSYAFLKFQFQQSHSPYDLYLYSIDMMVISGGAEFDQLSSGLGSG